MQGGFKVVSRWGTDRGLLSPFFGEFYWSIFIQCDITKCPLFRYFHGSRLINNWKCKTLNKKLAKSILSHVYSRRTGQPGSTQNHSGNVSILISCQPRLPLQMVHKRNVAEHIGIPYSWRNMLFIGNTGAWPLEKAFKIKLSVGSSLCCRVSLLNVFVISRTLTFAAYLTSIYIGKSSGCLLLK